METPAPLAGEADWALPAYAEALYTPRLHDHVLIIPVINEGERIRAQLQRVVALGAPIDIVVADGGSTDGSLDPAFVSALPIRAVLTKTGPGKLSAQLRMAYGWALKQGYRGIITVDGNGKDGVEAIPAFIDKLRDGYDYVQGSRYRPGGLAENTPLERTLANRLIHAPMLSLSGRQRYTDTTNGFRGYSADYLLHPQVQPFRAVFARYELLFYLTVRAGQLGLKRCEIPVRRSYPMGEAPPTKIHGSAAKADMLKQTLNAALGRYNP